MKRTPITVLLLFILLYCNAANAQTHVSIPAYTAYAVPAEESSEDDESKIFSEKEGIHNWTDTKQQLEFYFKIRTSGMLELSLLMKADRPGNILSVSVSGKNFILNVPFAKDFKQVKICSMGIKDTGFYKLSILPVRKKGNIIADIKSLELNGAAVKNIHFNSRPRRNAASVHLFYPVPDTARIISFYNEITIPKNADVLHSYYMASGFARGYFGIQVNSPSERRVIFSVWDAGNEAVDRNKVSDENRVKLLAKGEDVFADDFGNEGTGGHSHWVYDWKTEETYKFLVTAAIDSASASTTYTGYFFIPETQKWKLIACFKAPKDGKFLRKLYSFVENFQGNNGQLYRRADFGNQWIRNDKGDWKELTAGTFSYDATGKAGDRIDYGARVQNNKFCLWNGGFKETDTKFADEFTRTASGERPAADLYKNADSVLESKKENAIILGAIKNGQYDTTGSANGVYYKIVQDGSGDYVAADDTVIVKYRGQLLNGGIFDETREKPATFPLKRLIKGWQVGLPYCRAGGKIRLIIPSHMAYSIRNSGKIPPNSILVFDVEVLEIKKHR